VAGAIRFKLPSGHTMCLFAGKSVCGAKSTGDTKPSAAMAADVKGVGLHWLRSLSACMSNWILKIQINTLPTMLTFYQNV